MPNHGKGGRKLHGDEKKASAIRVAPKLKAQLDEVIKESGWSRAREIEERFRFTLEVAKDSRTLSLLREIAQDIARAEKLTGKAWDKDLRTWALVRAAFRGGALERACPDVEQIDSDEEGPRADLAELERKMALDSAVLGRLGVNVHRARSGGWPPKTDAALVECQIAERDPALHGPLTDALAALMRHEADYWHHWRALQSLRSEFNAVVDRAFHDWNDEERRRGRLVRREYEPATIDYIPQHNTGSISLNTRAKNKASARIRFAGLERAAILKLRSGPPPASVDDEDSGKALCTIHLPDNWAEAEGWRTIKAADATGVLGHFRIYGDDGTPHAQGTAGPNEDDDITTDKANVTAGQPLRIVSL